MQYGNIRCADANTNAWLEAKLHNPLNKLNEQSEHRRRTRRAPPTTESTSIFTLDSQCVDLRRCSTNAWAPGAVTPLCTRRQQRAVTVWNVLAPCSQHKKQGAGECTPHVTVSLPDLPTLPSAEVDFLIRAGTTHSDAQHIKTDRAPGGERTGEDRRRGRGGWRETSATQTEHQEKWQKREESWQLAEQFATFGWSSAWPHGLLLLGHVEPTNHVSQCRLEQLDLVLLHLDPLLQGGDAVGNLHAAGSRGAVICRRQGEIILFRCDWSSWGRDTGSVAGSSSSSANSHSSVANNIFQLAVHTIRKNWKVTSMKTSFVTVKGWHVFL